MRNTLILLLLLASTMATAQELDVSVQYNRTSSQNGFEFVAVNRSPIEVISSVTVTLQGGAKFDHSSQSPTPDIGINNDGLESTTLTWSGPFAPGDQLQATGDVDPAASPTGLVVTINFQTAGARTITLQPTVTDEWAATLSENREPTPIINGLATATISWLRPTEYVDNSPLPVEDISGYVVYWDAQPGGSRCGSGPVEILDRCYANALDLVDGASQSTPLQLSLNGDTTLYFAMVAYTTGDDSNVNLSDYSNEILKVFTVQIETTPDPDPEAPILIEVDMQITCTTDIATVSCTFDVQ